MKPCTLAFAVMLQHYDAAVKGGRLINQLKKCCYDDTQQRLLYIW